MKRNFLLCGSLGWCMEIFWTGFHSLLDGQGTMMGKTSLLMFPVFLRGCLYTFGIFFTEFLSGSILKHFGICPWDYSHTPFHFRGVIRLDYAPVWFVTGLLFEKILIKSS